MSKSLRDFQPKAACAASTAKRLCNKAQGWTKGTTLGPGGAWALNPSGVVANRVIGDWFSGHRAATPLGLEFPAAF